MYMAISRGSQQRKAQGYVSSSIFKATSSENSDRGAMGNYMKYGNIIGAGDDDVFDDGPAAVDTNMASQRSRDGRTSSYGTGHANNVYTHKVVKLKQLKIKN